jgi:hypothetical protein
MQKVIIVSSCVIDQLTRNYRFQLYDWSIFNFTVKRSVNQSWPGNFPCWGKVPNVVTSSARSIDFITFHQRSLVKVQQFR